MRLACLMTVVALAGCDTVFGLKQADAQLDVAMGDATGNAPAGCPAGFNADGYLFVPDLVNWVAAEQACVAMSSSGSKHVHLAVLDDEVDLLASSGVRPIAMREAWIGLTDLLVEGTFQWVSAEPAGAPTTVMWGSSEPNGATQSNCVKENSASGRLDDDTCSDLHPFICECDDFAEDSTHF